MHIHRIVKFIIQEFLDDINIIKINSKGPNVEVTGEYDPRNYKASVPMDVEIIADIIHKKFSKPVIFRFKLVGDNKEFFYLEGADIFCINLTKTAEDSLVLHPISLSKIELYMKRISKKLNVGNSEIFGDKGNSTGTDREISEG